MLKAYKYRIYPNNEQRQMIEMHFGHRRHVYNWALAQKEQYYRETGKNLSKRQLQDRLVARKKEEEWLSEVNSQTLLAALDTLHTAFLNFFKGRSRFPCYKKKYCNYQSFQCPQHVKLDEEEGLVSLPKIRGIKIKLHRYFVGKIKTCTVSKTPSNKYYISILVDDGQELPAETDKITESKTVGIDLGLKDFCIDSKGGREESHKSLEKAVKREKLLYRRLSKKQKGSNNRKKARTRLAKHKEKIANKRTDKIHKVTAKLVYESQDTCFALEDLNVKGMLKNGKLAKAIQEASWSKFVTALTYKASWKGKKVFLIDRWFPSSKCCSDCGYINEDLTLATRYWQCKSCGAEHDRDINAARNIKTFALRELLGQGLPEVKPVDHALTGTAPVV